MNLYDLHAHPETLPHYKERFEIPHLAYEEALRILDTGKRSSEMEHILAKHPAWALKYMRSVIRGRYYRKEKDTWQEGEEAIARSPEMAYDYALDDLRTRFPVGEPTIMKHPKWAYWYAKNIIKARWPEAEPYIMKDPEWAYTYARYVMDERWKEAEPYISKDQKWFRAYDNLFGVSLKYNRPARKRTVFV